MPGLARLSLRLLIIGIVGVCALFLAPRSEPNLVAFAKTPDAAKPSITFAMPDGIFKPDAHSFGLLIESTKHLTPNSQFFYRTPEGLNALKSLGVKTIVYMVDWNNWKQPYDDFTGEPQTYPSVMKVDEVVDIAKSVGAEIVPMLNVTVQCKRANPTLPYASANMACQFAKAKDSVKLVKRLHKLAQQKGVEFDRVIMGVEPYGGCAYWTNPQGVNCIVGNPYGQHRISLPAEVYASRVNEWAAAIHAVYPNIKIGAHVRTNTHTCITSCDREWTQVVLQDAGANIDFLVVHQYFRIAEDEVTDTATAQKLSYFQNQVDVNVRKIGRTGVPQQVRKEIMQWAPANKKNMPFWYAEFNAAVADEVVGYEAAQIRESLYSGISVGEMYLNMLSPTMYNNQPQAGAARAFLHHLFAEPTFIGAYQGQTMIYTPAWQILSSLSDFSNQTWLAAKGQYIPKATTGNGLIVAYGARKGKKVTLALFNHSNDKTLKTDLRLTGMTPKSAKMVTVGDTAASLLDQNNPDHPDLITPQSSNLAGKQVKNWGLKTVKLPPHSVTVIKVKLK